MTWGTRLDLGWGGIQRHDLVLSCADASGDPNGVLVSRAGQALTIDATKTVALLEGAYWSQRVRDAHGELLRYIGAYQLLLDLTHGLPTASSDIAVSVYLANAADPAAATVIAYASLRFDGAQADPDFSIQGGAWVAAASAEKLAVSAGAINYVSGSLRSYFRQGVGFALGSDDTNKAILTGNIVASSVATDWYAGIVVSPLSGAGGATDTLTVAGSYIASDQQLQ